MSTFNKILDNITGSHVYIQTHDFPDPDAIASAYGLAELMKIHGIDASICYRGKIERYSTNGMVKALDIDMISHGPEFINEFARILTEYNIPIVTPPGGLGLHINAREFVGHIQLIFNS